MSDGPISVQREDVTIAPAVAANVEPIVTASPEVTKIVPHEQNFRIDVAYTSEGYDGFNASLDTAAMPSGTDEQIRAALRDTPNLKAGMDKDTEKFISVINSALSTMPTNAGLVNTAHRQGAMYLQQVPSATTPLFGSTPKFKKKEGVKYTGESARNLIRSTMKLGTVFSVPLWHSGFWITLRAPSESDLLELYRKITQDKITLGRSTYGLMFSNVSSYTNKTMLDFIMENLYETSLATKGDESVRDYIKLPDLSLLIWGMACATWPNGFQYQRACITDIDKCKHVVSEKLSLSRLLWTDTSSLTPRQIQHMTNRQRGSVDLEAVKRYTDEFLRGRNSKVVINDELSFILKMPTAAEHIDSGYRWINHIEEEYGRAMTQDESSRNDYLLSHAQATSMRQYAHFVSSVLVGGTDGDTPEEIDGMEEIENALSDLSSRDDVRDLFMTKTSAFLDDSIISFVGIPTYKCPACGGDQRHSAKELNELGEKANTVRYPELIPLDVAQTFFPLLIQKILRIRER